MVSRTLRMTLLLYTAETDDDDDDDNDVVTWALGPQGSNPPPLNSENRPPPLKLSVCSKVRGPKNPPPLKFKTADLKNCAKTTKS